MTRGVRLFAVGLTAIVASTSITPDAEARKRDRHSVSDWYDDLENRRDARRAGVVAGVVAGNLAGASADRKAEERYQQCLRAGDYDYDCERRRYHDEMEARRAARRTGVVVGVTTRAIVRN